MQKQPIRFVVANDSNYGDLMERRTKEKMLWYAVDNDNDLLLELLFELDPDYAAVCEAMIDVVRIGLFDVI